MTHYELYNRFQSIQSNKNNLKNEMFNYILCTLKTNEGCVEKMSTSVQLDKLEENFPFVINVAGKQMRLMGVYLKEEKDVHVKVFDTEKSRIHYLFLETDNMENLESTAAFLNRTLVEIGEKNLYNLLILYSNKNSRNLYPNTLKNLNDGDVWGKLMGLKNHEIRIFQLKGPKPKFMDFNQFIEEVNEDGFSGWYAIQLHLKEKYL